MTTSLKNILMDLEKIKSYLPHRDPLLLIENVHEVSIGEKIVTSKKLLASDPVFAGHFPNYPIYPGVYYIEGLAQSGAILAYMTREKNGLLDDKLGVLTSVDEVRFRRPSGPGDTIRYEVMFERTRGPFIWMKGIAYIQDEIAVECKFSIALGARKGNEK